MFFLVPLWRRTNSAACWRSEQLLLHYQVSAFQLQTSAVVCWMPAAPNQLGWQAVGENMLLLIFCFYYPTQAMKRSKSTRACGSIAHILLYVVECQRTVEDLRQLKYSGAIA